MSASTTARTVAVGVAGLLDAASSREPFNPGDGLSDVPMERVVIDGERYVAKWIGPRIDWVMRATGDTQPEPRVVRLWRTGVLDRLPAIDATIHAVAKDNDLHVLLMRDASSGFLPEGHVEIPLAAHRRFLEHMAGMHASFAGFSDAEATLCTPQTRYSALSPAAVERERRGGFLIDGVRAAIEPGWAALVAAVPSHGERLLSLAVDPRPLAAALDQLPQTLVHGDWKAGNLGTTDDGRTILVDWAWPGAAPGVVDLAWYLAVNSTRLPETKEATIDSYRAALEAHGVDTGPWWSRALSLSLLGATLQLGWSKTSEPEELAWWCERALPVLDRL